MKSFILLCLAVAAAAFSHKELARFTEWQKKFEKRYDTRDEFMKRMEIFSKNMELIDQLNQANTTSRYAINQFADMSAEEWDSYPCGVKKLSDVPAPEGFEMPPQATMPEGLAAPPASWDWEQHGAVTPVKNQGQCGSCWAFSTIANIEGVWKLAGNPLTSLAENELVDCTHTSFGCQGGWPFWALTDVLKAPYNGQIDTEASWPYQPEDMSCTWNAPGRKVGATVASYKSYCTEQTAACDEDHMKSLLYTYGPLSACLDATPMQFYHGGVDNPANCDPNAIDHCITITGYGTDSAGTPFWRIKNSWGTSWGEKGYYQLIRGKGACGINKVITIAAAKKSDE